jgi:carbamoyltransferase
MLEHFDLDQTSPFMLRTCDVISPLKLPAITHVDNSARVQTVNYETNPLFASLIRKFDELTGCPILLNTSFNVRSEPIVESPNDALICFITTEIDCLVIGDFIIEREKNCLEMLSAILENMRVFERGSKKNLYTFI